VELLLSNDWQSTGHAIEAQLKRELEPCRAHPQVKDVRVLGGIGVVECHAAVDVALLQQQFVAAGVWIRPFSNLIYLIPPLIIKPRDLTRLTKAISNIFAES